MAVFEKSVPPPVGYRLIEPCVRCRHGEGEWELAWPGLRPDDTGMLCGRCLWSRFHDLPRGPIRRALVRRVFSRQVFRPASRFAAARGLARSS